MQRTIEHQSWVRYLGAKKCAKIEAIVDEFLAKHPSPENYDCGDYRALFPPRGVTKADRIWAWNDDIRDLLSPNGEDEDGAIYALRYARNEWELIKRPSLMDYAIAYAIHYYQKLRDCVGKVIPAVKRKKTKSFADFTF